MNHIYYQTKTLFSNTGDVLINKTLLCKLREYGIVKANCSSEIPQSFIEQLGIKEKEKISSDSELNFVFQIFKDAIKGYSVYIFSGLGHIQGGGRSRILRNMAASVLFVLYRLLGIHIIRIGFSIGPISKGLAITEFLRGNIVSHYYVRDSKSLFLVKRMGIKKAKICPDMSWLYNQEHQKQINDTNIVLLNFRNSRYSNSTNTFSEDLISQKCHEILSFLQTRMEQDLKVVIAYQVKEDYCYCKFLSTVLRNHFSVTFIEKQMDLEDAAKIYKTVSYTLSNRMHSLLLSYKYGSLPIALVDFKKNTKIVSTFEDCNLQKLLIDINEENITQSLSNILYNRQQYYQDILSIENEKCNEIIGCLNSIFYEKCHKISLL